MFEYLPVEVHCLAHINFADAFHGCYKNRTNGTRDYRWFAGLHLLMRFVLVAFYDLTSYNAISSVFMLLCVIYWIFVVKKFHRIISSVIVKPFRHDDRIRLLQHFSYKVRALNTSAHVNTMILLNTNRTHD